MVARDPQIRREIDAQWKAGRTDRYLFEHQVFELSNEAARSLRIVQGYIIADIDKISLSGWKDLDFQIQTLAA